MPRPELAAWRCLIDRLADRRVVATIETLDGITCYVLDAADSAPEARGGAVVGRRVALATDTQVEEHGRDLVGQTRVLEGRAHGLEGPVVELGPVADWGVPTGVSLAPAGDALVLGQRLERKLLES